MQAGKNGRAWRCSMQAGKSERAEQESRARTREERVSGCRVSVEVGRRCVLVRLAVRVVLVLVRCSSGALCS